jgi:hypothetical protein
MRNTKVSLLAILALCLLGLAVRATGTPMTMTISPPGQMTTTVAGAATLETFNNGSLPAGYTITSCKHAVACGVLSPTSHFGSEPTGDTTDYLATGNGTISITLATVATASGLSGRTFDYFGLYWGSIDDFNSVTFWDGSTEVGSFTGAQVATAASASGIPVTPGKTSLFVNFFANGYTWTTIDLTSTHPNFESDNHAFGPVPEPATMALMGIGLLVIALAVRRRKNVSGYFDRG